MPRYHFHVRNGDGLTQDEDGLELANAADARAEAIRSVRSIISAEVLEGRIDLSGDIEVETPAGERLFTFPFEAAFEVRRGAKSGR